MTRPQCIITGCLFFDPLSQRFVNGDLYRLSGVLIHAANFTNDGPDWQYGIPPTTSRVVSCIDGSYWDKRGIIVFAVAASDLNDTATQYLRESRY
jgi:hypothetical protein